MTVAPRPVGDDRGRRARTPADIPARGWEDVAVRVKQAVKEDHTMLAAAGVAFWAFLALIPALAAFASILGMITTPSTVTARADDLFGGLPTEARDLLTAQLETMAGSTSSSLTTGLIISLALALWSASGGMGALIEGINVAYDERDDRNFLAKKALAIALTLGAIVFMAATIVGLAALPAILDAIGLPGWLSTVLGAAFWPLVALGFLVGLSILYRYGPDRSSPAWSWVSRGAVVALLVWVLASVAFRIYTSNFGSYNESYGSLAAVVVLMLWLFLTAFAVLLGAHVNAESERQTSLDTTVGPPDPAGWRGATAADTLGWAPDTGDGDGAAGDGAADEPDRAVPADGRSHG